MPSFSQVAQLDLTEGAVPGGVGQRLVLHDPVTGRLDSFALGSTALIRNQDIATQPIGTMRSISFEGASHTMDQATLTRLVNAADANGASATSWLDGNSFFGNQVRLEMIDLGNQMFLAMSRPGGAGFSTYFYSPTGTLTPLQSLADTSRTDIAAVSAMAGARTGSDNWLITASMAENTLTLYKIKTDGRLAVKSTFGFDDQLPVNQPALLKTLEHGDTALIVMASYGSSSLTVMELQGDGSLHFRDQINDNRETRFAGVSAMDVIRVGGHDLVAVAGNDGGVSLYQILPNGRLLHRETLIDTLATALDGISDLQFSQTGAGLELWVMATRDKGLTRLSLDPESLGLHPPGHDGGDGTDVLVAAATGGTLRGNAGDDILLDGAGVDVLVGGAGADLFVFTPDGQTDTVHDFDPRSDKLDLSAYPMVQSVADLSVRATSGGAWLRLGTEELRIYTANGAQLSAAQLAPALIFGAGHVFMPAPVPQISTSGNDIFMTSFHPDTIDGGAGLDVVSYHQAASATIVNLGDNTQNAGAAAGYLLLNIEGITGTQFNDRLTGDTLANVLTGMAGHDRILGMGGNDWITPGAGRDTVDGGAGTDMVSFIDHAQAVIINLAEGTAVSARDTNQITGIENVTGSIYGDFIKGDAGANLLRGMGGYDWFVATAGADTYDGSNGRDMVSYIEAPGAVTVDLGAGRGLAGQALGQSYIQIERITGSVHPDLFYGSAGEDDFRGAGGYDWFVDSAGRDRYDGGTGLDTVSYANATTGITASLILGRGGPQGDRYTAIENLTGSNLADALTGDNGRNILRGQYGNDRLFGNGGNDRLEGGGADDYLDGGTGWDVAVFSGNRRDYAITTRGDLTTVTHLNSGRDGVDVLHDIEVLSFADSLLYL